MNASLQQRTPKGAGALALIRISGEHAFDVLAPYARLSSKKDLRHIKHIPLNMAMFLMDRVQLLMRCSFLLCMHHAPLLVNIPLRSHATIINLLLKLL